MRTITIESLEARRLMSTNLLVNGDFESPPIGSGALNSDFTEYAKGKLVGSAGWKVTAGGVDIVSDTPGHVFDSLPASGNQYLDLAGFVPSPPASIAQVVPTVRGRQYQVRFAYTDTPFVANPNDVEVRGTSVLANAVVLGTVTKDIAGESPADPGWAYATYTFTATSGRTTLTFRSTTSGEEGVALDDVSLTQLPVSTSVDLTGTVSVVAPASGQVKPGHAVTLSVALTNDGASAAKGPVQIDFGLSPNADGSAPALNRTLTRTVNIPAGGHLDVRIPVSVPAGFAPGAYFATATIDPDNTLGETNPANNSAVAVTPFIVLGIYPDVLGTYSGPARVLRGPDKAGPFTEVATYLTEGPSTGAFTESLQTITAVGTLTVPLAGTVSTTGVIAVTNPTVVLKAKLSGKVIRGSYAQPNGDYATFTLTRQS